MELSSYVEGLRRDLNTLTRFAPDEVNRVAQQLSDALDSPVRLTLLDALTTAAAEITERLDAAIVDLRLISGEPEFVVTVMTEPAPRPAPPQGSDPAADDGTVRVTLRLSEGLKSRIEASAAATGVSVNTWLVQAANRALDYQAGGPPPGGQRPRTGPGNRITGFARS
jgi:hypothetical protein